MFTKSGHRTKVLIGWWCRLDWDLLDAIFKRFVKKLIVFLISHRWNIHRNCDRITMIDQNGQNIAFSKKDGWVYAEIPAINFVSDLVIILIPQLYLPSLSIVLNVRHWPMTCVLDYVVQPHSLTSHRCLKIFFFQTLSGYRSTTWTASNVFVLNGIHIFCLN